ncbi:MAG: DUF378 domain-containing protein [Candidatus Magasanikbacteria bacterium]|nr:DUF378 domain-containing protein [Candidatus Magasanikbacteria bacterium]
MGGLTKLCWVLLIVGGLNWGLVGAFEWNLVTALFGSVEWLERLVYILVGLSALCGLATLKKGCCSKKA